MRRLVVIVAIVMALVMVAAKKVKADLPSDNLIEALIAAESSGNDYAVGDENLPNKAYGPLQIRQPYVDDYNRWHKTSYKAEDCLGNRPLSIKICKSYIDHYATAARLGRIPTDEDKARIHNGGPSGWKKNSTVKYWTTVKEYLAKQ
jgi:hypothetical protein